ncbi:MAG: phosphatase PAP2 family protein [Bacteroidales bacterium]|nr:phosphatase PAP2 family protein [Bacteroidales bacterium]
MLERLASWDRQLLLFINGHHNDFLDIIMFYASNKFIWIPLYVILVFVIFRIYGMKSIWILLTAVLLIAASDLISVHAFKNVFERLRPCHEPDLEGLIHTVRGKCGGKYGFYSSHATNHFALAGFLSFILSKKISWFPVLIFVWAAFVSYSRIYLGAHYPGDVLAGAFAGLILSVIFFNTYIFIQNRMFKR